MRPVVPTKPQESVADTNFVRRHRPTRFRLALERTPANALIRRYIQTPTGPLSFTTPTGTSYYHRDFLGSIRSVTNATGAELWRYDYDPYGEDRGTSQMVTGAPTTLHASQANTSFPKQATTTCERVSMTPTPAASKQSFPSHLVETVSGPYPVDGSTRVPDSPNLVGDHAETTAPFDGCKPSPYGTVVISARTLTRRIRR